MKQTLLRIMKMRALQPMWRRMAHLSLIGQNYWGTNIADTGELDVLRMLRSRIGTAGVVFDVGANTGQYARTVLEILQPAALHSFEPSSAAFAELEQVKGVIAHRLALSEQAGERRLYTAEPGATVASLLNLRDPLRPFTGQNDEMVAVQTLDSFCDAHGVSNIDLLKIDVEGGELAVLRGAVGLLARQAIRFVQFEFGEGHIDARTFLRDFFDLLGDFDLYRVVPGGLVPLGAYRPELEVFAPINYFAELRR